ncbi:MAG: hypothetical protein ACLU94_02605 [Catenibacillus sp.]
MKSFCKKYGVTVLLALTLVLSLCYILYLKNDIQKYEYPVGTYTVLSPEQPTNNRYFILDSQNNYYVYVQGSPILEQGTYTVDPNDHSIITLTGNDGDSYIILNNGTIYDSRTMEMMVYHKTDNVPVFVNVPDAPGIPD